MFTGNQSRSFKRIFALLLACVAVIVLLFVIAASSAAQIHGIPPSVTSIQNHLPPYMPNIPASVTSLGPRGYIGPPAFPVYPANVGRFGHGMGNRFRNGYGYSGGAYIAPYYIPAYDASYGYDNGAGGPYMYSGPPAEQTLHIVVDMPTEKRVRAEDDVEDSAPSAKSNLRRGDTDISVDARPVDPTVLIFRDGHRQEVSNYAIMGQTVYIFDQHTQKIAITDLDVGATVKANDDRGVEFHVPTHTKSPLTTNPGGSPDLSRALLLSH